MCIRDRSASITLYFSMIMHGPMEQGSVHNSWKLKIPVPVLPWPAHSLDMSPIEHVWDALDWRVRQCVPVPPISSNFAQPLKRSGKTFHRPQLTAWATLCEGEVWRCMRQMVFTPDTDCFFLRYLWPTDAYLYFQSCEIHRLGLNAFISTHWFPYMNCNNSNIFVEFIFLFSVFSLC